MKLPIKIILRYSGLGLMLATVIYSEQTGAGLDIKTGSMFFLALCWLASSWFWKEKTN
jgi:hypothetical protein